MVEIELDARRLPRLGALAAADVERMTAKPTMVSNGPSSGNAFEQALPAPVAPPRAIQKRYRSRIRPVYMSLVQVALVGSLGWKYARA